MLCLLDSNKGNILELSRNAISFIEIYKPVICIVFLLIWNNSIVENLTINFH
jgi:hypothetical protein